jgi:hypothetical protein
MYYLRGLGNDRRRAANRVPHWRADFIWNQLLSRAGPIEGATTT